ncbi:MAG: acid stress chaperone HdeA [Mycobacterium sp.]|jgi:acid stress chaperone HdeA|nr:acid stress chaperone HdeA [Mycobacterium sp.]MDT5212455.1 acid stress chaperone HdeA [Mycobacterium sp.]MDT5396853.1 acid stress chaperone HdeA [Mycobacterium sp.]MDT7758699.1 acid stress chaperone HdeA [Mycobacterium sp.]
MKRSASVLMSGLVAGLVLGGCSAPSIQGGDTSCKDYLAADENTKTEAVTKMLKDEKGADAAQLEITGTKMAVQTYCQTVATPDTKIKATPHL